MICAVYNVCCIQLAVYNVLYIMCCIQYEQLNYNKVQNNFEKNSRMATSTINQAVELEQQIYNKYQSLDPLAQIQLLKNQHELLTSIKQLLQRRKYNSNNNYSGYNMQILSINGINYANTNNTNASDMLDLSTNSIGLGLGIGLELDQEQSVINRSKFRQQIQSSSYSSALKQIQQKCSQQTYEMAKQYFNNTKILTSTNNTLSSLQKLNIKLLEQRDQLSSQLLIQQLQKNNMEKQLVGYKKSVQLLEQEKAKIRKKTDYLLKKENQISKLQSSFTFKQKINLQLKKRYERLVIQYRNGQKKLQNMFAELHKIWELILKKMQQNNGNVQKCNDGNCWRKQVMKKVKQQLIEERKLLKQEAMHLQKQYSVMSVVSEQFKRIFQQNQKYQKNGLDSSELIGTQRSFRAEENQSYIRLSTRN